MEKQANYKEEKEILEEPRLDEKLKNLEIELEKTKQLAEDRLNSLKYMQADFDNYRKRFEKEREQIIILSNESLIKELIVILDDFDAAINLSIEKENKEGLKTLKKKFFEILLSHGLNEIESLGKKLNPNFHDVLCSELSKHDEDEVIEEIQKGYTLNSKVIRPSKVKISKGETEEN
jgi:molecular chaperone GrpE